MCGGGSSHRGGVEDLRDLGGLGPRRRAQVEHPVVRVHVEEERGDHADLLLAREVAQRVVALDPLRRATAAVTRAPNGKGSALCRAR